MGRARAVAAGLFIALLASCGTAPGSPDGVYAPAHDPRADAVDGMLVGHRLMEAGEYELALEAFQRAAAERGLTTEVLSAIGTANLGLGRLNQAEEIFRRATSGENAEEPWPEVWNNLGVVLMERGKTAEAAQIFRKAYALDNGQSDAIRDNLRLALEKLDETAYDPGQEQDYKLVRRGSGSFLIRRVP